MTNMILKNSFYSLKSQQLDDNKIQATFDIDGDHEVFAGHFPEQPIVPGVFQIQLVKEVLADSIQKKLQLDTSKEIKFLRPISPEAFKDLELIINVKEQSDKEVSFSAQIKNTEAVFLKYRGIYKVV